MDRKDAICFIWPLIGVYLPWTLLFSGAALSLLGSGPLMGIMSAAMVVLGLILMLLVAGLLHIHRALSS